MDYYKVLKVTREASIEEIKKAYHERIKECHPDRVHNLDEDFRKMAREKVLKINEAYDFLRKPNQKAKDNDKSLLKIEETCETVEEREKFRQEEEKEEKEKKEEKERQSRRKKHEDGSIVSEAFLKIIEEKIRNQNETVKWSRGYLRNFNLTLEGHKRREEYKIYLKTFTQLGEKGLKSVIRQMGSLEVEPVKLWSTRFTTVCLAAEDFNNLVEIKKMVKKYNSQRQGIGAKLKRGKSIIAIVDITTRKVFSPFSEKFKPHLRNIY